MKKSRISALLASMIYGMNSMPGRSNQRGTGEKKRQRSPELVEQLKNAAITKRARKARKLWGDAVLRDAGYYRADRATGLHCFNRAGDV